MKRIVVLTLVAWFCSAVASLAAPTLGSNVQIGNSSDVETVRIDWDRENDHLFAVTLDASGDIDFYTSSDSGASWSKRFTLTGASATVVDLAVVGDWVYLAYEVAGPDLRVRRVSRATGGLDVDFNTVGYDVWIDDAGSAFEEIAMTSNADDADGTFYVAALHADDTVSFFWDLASSGNSPTAAHPGVSNAESGLAISWNVGYPSASASGTLVVLSYVGTDDQIWFYQRGPGGGVGSWDSGTDVQNADVQHETTSVSAFEDNFMVVFKATGSEGSNSLYRVSYDGGSSWSWGHAGIAEPGEGYIHPLVSARSGTGFAIVSQQEAGAVDRLEMVERQGYPYVEFEPEARMNDDDFMTGDAGFDFEWMGAGWALAYVNAADEAMFTWSSPVRYSGFEYSGLGEWSSAVGGP